MIIQLQTVAQAVHASTEQIAPTKEAVTHVHASLDTQEPTAKLVWNLHNRYYQQCFFYHSILVLLPNVL